MDLGESPIQDFLPGQTKALPVFNRRLALFQLILRGPE